MRAAPVEKKALEERQDKMPALKRNEAQISENSLQNNYIFILTGFFCKFNNFYINSKKSANSPIYH